MNRNFIVQKLERQLDISNRSLSRLVDNNPLPIPAIIGGIGIVALLASLIAYKKIKRNKYGK
jgi:hypothetical protein